VIPAYQHEDDDHDDDDMKRQTLRVKEREGSKQTTEQTVK